MAGADPQGQIRPLAPADAQAAGALFQEIWRTTPAGFLTFRDPAGFDQMTGPDSASVGWFAGTQLRAYAFGLVLGAGRDCPARRQGLLRRDAEPVGLLQGTLVHPDSRGLGLHGRLYTARRDLLVARGVAQQMGIVFLENLISLEANLKCGLLVRGLVEDADGWNFLVYVDASETARPDAARAERIATDDLPRQADALGRGLWGWSLAHDAGRAWIRYAPPRPPAG